MRLVELKRKVGYFDLLIEDKCGNCANCTERGNHLRCAKWGFAVNAMGICRNGYVKGHRQVELALVPNEHPTADLLIKVPATKLLGYSPEEPAREEPTDDELEAMALEHMAELESEPTDEDRAKWEEHCADEARDEEAAR